MSFRFRLATLLRLREQTRDERRRELAQAFEAERILQERQNLLYAELSDNQALLRGLLLQTEVQIDQLSHTRRYEALLKMQVVQLRTQIEQVAQEVERRRQALLESDREVKALEKLSERQLHAYEKQLTKLENQQLDEAALRGFRVQSEVLP